MGPRVFAFGLAVVAGLCVGCDEAREKIDRIVREEKFKVVEKTGDAIEERADQLREGASDKISAGIKGGEQEAPADAELRNEAKGKPEPSAKAEEDDPTK